MRRIGLTLLMLLCSAASLQTQDELPHCHVPGPFILFFDANSAELTPQAKEVLEHAIQINESVCSWPRAMLTGHTDTRELPALADQRNKAAYRYLKRNGWRIQSVRLLGFGARAPRIATLPNVSERQNRRVEVSYFYRSDTDVR